MKSRPARRTIARATYLCAGNPFVGERTGAIAGGAFLFAGGDRRRDRGTTYRSGEVGPKVAASIAEFFSEPANRKLSRSSTKPASIRPWKSEVKSAQICGQVVCVYRRTRESQREDAAEIVKQHGGKISSSVSKKTDYVVVGTDPGRNTTKRKRWA